MINIMARIGRQFVNRQLLRDTSLRNQKPMQSDLDLELVANLTHSCGWESEAFALVMPKKSKIMPPSHPVIGSSTHPVNHPHVTPIHFQYPYTHHYLPTEAILVAYAPVQAQDTETEGI